MRLAWLAMAGVCALAAEFAAPPAQAQVSVVDGGARYGLKVTSLRDIPFRTVVRQQYDYSCGSAALATLLRHHYGLEVDESGVFRDMYAHGDQAKIRKLGFSLLDMKRYLEHRGLHADGYRATLDQMETAKAPAITVVRIGAYRHFVVIKGVRGDQVLVGDPALGLKIYSRAEFSKLWNGVIFAIHGSEIQRVAYNRDEEWSPWALAPLGRRLSDGSLSAFTRDLPPIYQVTNIVNVGAPFR
jgi:predicted double-glycine peptidase